LILLHITMDCTPRAGQKGLVVPGRGNLLFSSDK
jgi:hypothetical protein